MWPFSAAMPYFRMLSSLGCCDRLIVSCSNSAALDVLLWSTFRGTWWRTGWVDSFQPEGRGFDSRPSRQVGTLGKSLTHNCLWCFGMKLWHSIRAVSGVLLSRSGLELELMKIMICWNISWMYNCPVPWYTVVDEMYVDEMSVDEVS